MITFMNHDFDKLIKQSKILMDKPNLKHRHFSFIMQKGQVMSVGYNTLKTHPLAVKYGYPYFYQHSELNSVIKFPDKIDVLRKCVIVNIRLNAKGRLLMSKPCKYCQALISSFGIKQVYYSNSDGGFELMRI